MTLIIKATQFSCKFTFSLSQQLIFNFQHSLLPCCKLITSTYFIQNSSSNKDYLIFQPSMYLYQHIVLSSSYNRKLTPILAQIIAFFFLNEFLLTFFLCYVIRFSLSTGFFPYKLRNSFKIAHQQKQTKKQANKNFPLTPHSVGATAYFSSLLDRKVGHCLYSLSLLLHISLQNILIGYFS